MLNTLDSGDQVLCHAVVRRRFQKHLPLFAALMLASSTGLWAQSADIAGQQDAEDRDETSQHVEESEEAFRRRMETAESHDQADVIRPRSSGTSKVPEGMDALPADSRKHLRDELRNVIIEKGEWQPEDAGTVYPYVPSAAAEKDPELRQQEQQAWGELVQEYHKREAAAFSMGGGRSGSRPEDEQQPTSAGSSGSANNRKASDPAERSATQAAGSTAAGAGVSQSALEFLKRQQAGPSGTSANNQASAQAASQQEGQPGASSASSGQERAEPEPQAQLAAAQSSADKPEEQPKREQEEQEESEPPPPPGSLAIAELAALEEKTQRLEDEQALNARTSNVSGEPESDSSSEQEQSSSVTRRSTQSTDQPPPPPGTLAIPELEKLRGIEEEPPPLDTLPDADQ